MTETTADLETEFDRVSRSFRGDEDDPYIVAGRTLSPERRSIVLEIVTRLLFHTIIMVSLYFLIAGHNLPGGGFAGGLTAGLALTLRYLAGGRYELWRSTPINAGTMLGLGLAIAAVYAIAPIFFGGSIMQSYTFEWTWPIIGEDARKSGTRARAACRDNVLGSLEAPANRFTSVPNIPGMSAKTTPAIMTPPTATNQR